MTYTQIAVAMIVATVVLDMWVLRTRLLTRKAFWTAYAIVVFFQLLTNGVLTGFNIVRYNGDVIIGSDTPVLIGDGRLIFAPIEDLMFGFSLVVQSMAWWVFWGRRGVQVEPKAGPVRLWFGIKPKD
jgi:lycopene cyclase domain-containing protein